MAKNNIDASQEPPFGMFLLYMFMMVWPLLAIAPLVIPIVSSLRDILNMTVSQFDRGEYQAALIVSSTVLAVAALVFIPFLFFYKRMVHNFFHPRIVYPNGRRLVDDSSPMTPEPEG
jgi:hypothetical protein